MIIWLLTECVHTRTHARSRAASKAMSAQEPADGNQYNQLASCTGSCRTSIDFSFFPLCLL